MPRHAPRRHRLIEDVYKEIAGDTLPEGRYYLVLVVGGEDLSDGNGIQMPSIKYIFNQ